MEERFHVRFLRFNLKTSRVCYMKKDNLLKIKFEDISSTRKRLFKTPFAVNPFVFFLKIKLYRATFEERKKINSRGQNKELRDNDLMCFPCFIENLFLNSFLHVLCFYFFVWLIYWFVKSFLRATCDLRLHFFPL